MGNMISFLFQMRKVIISHVLGGPNTDKHGRKQYLIKYSGFFLLVMKYASGIRTS